MKENERFIEIFELTGTYRWTLFGIADTKQTPRACIIVIFIVEIA